MREAAPLTPVAMAGWWGVDPADTCAGLLDDAAAVLWDIRAEKPLEIYGEPDPNTYVLSCHLSRFRHDSWIDGKMSYRHPAERGTVSLVRAGARPRSVLYNNAKMLQLLIPKAAVTRCARDLASNGSEVELIDPKVSRDVALSALAEVAVRAMTGSHALTRLEIEGILQAMIAGLIGRWSNLAPLDLSELKRAGGLAPWQLNRVRELLFARLSEEVGVEELAAEAGLSPFHFARCFKATTGEPPHRFLIRIRIERARELLTTTNLPISEVAAQVGYSEPSYLARLFRRELGVTPRQLRQERRG